VHARLPRTKREAKPKPKRALPRENEGLAASSVVGAVALFLIATACLCLLINFRSLPLAGVATLVLIAALTAGGFAWFFVPQEIEMRAKRSIGVGVAIMTLIIGLLAIPNETSGAGDSADSTPEPPSDQEPLYVTLEKDSECEPFVVKNKLLRSIRSRAELNAKWFYDNGGSRLPGRDELTVQGSSLYATILTGLRVIDLQSAPAPKNVSVVSTCPRPQPWNEPGRSAPTPRHFAVILDAPGPVVGVGEEATRFPYLVSPSDVEDFILKIGSSRKCVCEFRLALDWTKLGSTGTKIIEDHYGSFRTYTGTRKLRMYYRNRDGTWDPPLPK
jgi:hypothetical protein